MILLCCEYWYQHRIKYTINNIIDINNTRLHCERRVYLSLMVRSLVWIWSRGEMLYIELFIQEIEVFPKRWSLYQVWKPRVRIMQQIYHKIRLCIARDAFWKFKLKNWSSKRLFTVCSMGMAFKLVLFILKPTLAQSQNLEFNLSSCSLIRFRKSNFQVGAVVHSGFEQIYFYI